MQAGRQKECSACHPEKGYADCQEIYKGMEPLTKCECICHDIPQSSEELKKEFEELKQELWVDVLEDYYFLVEMTPKAKNQAKNMEDCRNQLDKIVHWIMLKLAKQQEELRDMLIRKSVAIDMGGINTRIVNLDSAIADIKSKLK